MTPGAWTPSPAEQPFPLGAALAQEELERYDNAGVLRRLREEEPVSWFAQSGVWLVTSRALVDEVHMDPARFVVEVPDNPQRVVLGRMMLVVDGGEHTRHRAPFAQPFKYSAVRERFTEVVVGHVERLVAAVEGRGAAELATTFANPFAVSVASDVLGLGFEHVDEVHEIYSEFAEGLVGYRDPDAVERGRRAGQRLDGHLLRRIDRLRSADDGSLLSAVLHAAEVALRSDEEVLANLRVILFGAIETVESMILNTTWALLRHPEARDEVAADPALWPAAVQEGLRWIPPVGYSDRWAAQDTVLGSVTIRRGDYVIPVFHAANRDPAAFPDPDRFDIRRSETRQNLSFGKGIHMCLGVNLARLQGVIALRSLFERLPRLRLDPEHPSEPIGFNFRRPPHLHVLWDTAGIRR